MHLSGKEDLEADNLPYDEQRRLEIARALATDMKLLLLDEPAAGMNPKVLRELLNEESYICVGRAADFVLKDKPNVLTVYIDAPYEERIEREMKRQGIGRSQIGRASCRERV